MTERFLQFALQRSRAAMQAVWTAVPLAFFAAALMFAAAPKPAQAADEPAEVLVEGLTNEVMAFLQANPALTGDNLDPLIALVDQKILPHMNFQRMTASSVGPGWRQATPEQRRRLETEFKLLLVRTYASAIVQLRDNKVTVKPLRMNSGDGKQAIVRMEVRGPKLAEPIMLDYRLEKTPGQGRGWKVYNINVLGVWLVETYRSQFAEEVGARGIDGLIAMLSERNKANAAK